MIDFKKTNDYKDLLLGEYEPVRQYHLTWAGTPHPVTFCTVDALVACSGHILLVKRKFFPGKGLWALPGGFLDPSETLKEGMLRELREETRLRVPNAVLAGSIVGEPFIADLPRRDPRGRVISHVFVVSLKNGPLPEVRANDDAKSAAWVKLSELSPDQFFVDHYSIIKKLLPRLT